MRNTFSVLDGLDLEDDDGGKQWPDKEEMVIECSTVTNFEAEEKRFECSETPILLSSSLVFSQAHFLGGSVSQGGYVIYENEGFPQPLNFIPVKEVLENVACMGT